MIPVKFTYSFDPTGGASANLVPEETHNITPVNGDSFRFIVPKLAPYFLNSIKLFHTSTGVELIRGQDWVPGHALDAIKNYPPYLDVYGSILILNNRLSDGITVKPYQTIGGEYTIDSQTLLTVLANVSIDPRTAYWEDILDVPMVIDPLSHLHHISGTVGYGEMVAAFQSLVTKFVSENSKLSLYIKAHTESTGNTHGLTLTDLGIERFKTTHRAELTELLAGEENQNFITPDNFRRAVDAAIANLSLLGAEGDIPFHFGSGINFNVAMGLTRNRLAIVNTAAELTTQLASRESFSEVMNEWSRIAMRNNDLKGVPSELTSWTYDAATDKIVSAVNSTSLIGMYSPEKVVGDWTFEVEVASASADDDWIGIGLGLEAYGGLTRNLVLLRSASGPSTSASARPSLKLIYDQGNAGNATLAEINNLAPCAGGWLSYSGPIKIRARRVGTIIYITTNEPGGAYLPEVSFDLNSRAETKVFANDINLGYVCSSQDKATFKTLQRSGANLPIVALHTQQVHLWSGTNYVLSTEAVSKRLLRGRFWYNPVTKCTWYSPASGRATLVSNDAALKAIATKATRTDRVPYTGNDGVTYLGSTGELFNGSKTGGITLDAQGQLTFLGNGNSALAYFDVSGKLRHWGVDHLSDVKLKRNIKRISTKHGLDYCSWTWADLTIIPEHIRGTVGYGVIAQEVLAKYPQFVTLGADNYYSVAEDKLALFLAMRNDSWWAKLKAKVRHIFK